MGLSSRSCFCPMQKTTAVSCSIQICNVNPIDQLAEWPSRNTAPAGVALSVCDSVGRMELRKKYELPSMRA